MTGGSGRAVELDFLRGIAILSVMFLHFGTVPGVSPFIEVALSPFTMTDGIGVDLFFVLSGFLVGGLLFKEWRDRGSIDARRFLIRRAFKILPAYYFLILFHVLLGRHPLDSFLWQNLTNLQNYFGSSIAQTWSLAIEEHFYLGAAFLLMAWATAGRGHRSLIVLLGLFCLVCLAARSYAVYGNGELREAYLYTQYRIDQLIFGVILAALSWMSPEVYRRIIQRRVWLVAGCALLVLWMVFVDPRGPLGRSIGFTVKGLGLSCLLLLTLHWSDRIKNFRVYRTVAWVGLYSYGIYLWHTVALEPGKIMIDQLTARGVGLNASTVVSLMIQTVLAITLGYIATRLIERPGLRLRERLLNANPAAIAGPQTENAAAG